MWLMLQQDSPDDYVIGTGETHSVREFAELAFGMVGLDADRYVVVDPDLYRPAEVNLLIGNPAKAQAKFGWAAKTSLEALVREMVAADCAAMGMETPFREAAKA